MEDVGHQIPVLADHLRDLRSGLIDQLLRPHHQLLQIVHRRSHRVDRGQRCLNHPIDYIEDSLNGLQYPQLRLCRLRRSHQRYNHDSGKRHRHESPVVLDCHDEPGKRCEKRHVQKNLHFLQPPEALKALSVLRFLSPLPP